ncbi:MAG: NitT/TauT family transport system permease protein [Alphaproteobacteria bacterium]|jgi:NitT/TauT family transport system permease protein|nr:NitT/TauT family transport system permease protein [Alphaproteobacteria bacterium]
MNAASDEQEVYQSQADRRAKQQYRRRVAIGQIAVIVTVIAAWHLGSGRLFDPFYVGSPIGVAKVLVDDFGDPRFWNDLRVTGTEMTLGYLVGGLSGIALGILFARWRLAADIFDPFFTGLNSLPRIALAPLLVIWFGIDMASKVVLAATLVFFLTFFTTLSGIRNVDQALVDVARLMGASDRQIFRYVMLPGAAAWIINGLKMSLPYALIGVIVGEFLIASSGLGYRLNLYSTSYNTNGTFAMLLVMMALMMGLNALMGLVERHALRWRAETTATVQPY